MCVARNANSIKLGRKMLDHQTQQTQISSVTFPSGRSKSAGRPSHDDPHPEGIDRTFFRLIACTINPES